jgi:hypothetical protein
MLQRIQMEILIHLKCSLYYYEFTNAIDIEMLFAVRFASQRENYN